MKVVYTTLTFLFVLLTSCENKNINEGEQFMPREINENYGQFHFNKITYDGINYLITERDNNNPHEGFGFMAYDGSELEKQQDSIFAYMKAIAEIQKRLYAKQYNMTQEEVDIEFNDLLSDFLE